MEWFNNKIMGVADRLENSSPFGAIRQGMIMMIPLLIVAYVSLMLISLPLPAYQEFITGLCDGLVVEILQFVYHGVNDFFSVILTITTTVSYARIKRRKANILVGNGDLVVLIIITLAAFAAYAGIQYDTFSVSMFTNANAFTALFISLVSGKLFFEIKKLKFLRLKKQGTNTDSFYVEAIEGILPAIIIMVFFALFHWLFQSLFGVSRPQDLLEMGANRFLEYIDSNFGSGIAVIISTHILWFFGIHGHNVLDGVIKQNFLDVSGGIFSKTFQDIFVIMGGTGSMLCLVISILIFSKKKSVRNIAKISAPSVVFNISEITLFGLPVIMSPIFLIPFMLVPIFNYLVAYIAISSGLVPRIVNMVEWTIPVVLSGYQATGSWRGAVLQIVIIAVGVCIYRPFVRLYEVIYDKRLTESVGKLVVELQKEEENNAIFSLTEREDELGKVARFMVAELIEAINKKELFLMYQPKIDTNGVCTGAEALLRWNHPIVGFIYPPLIIQLAKEEGILHELEKFIFDEAAATVSKLEKNVSSDFGISINITNESLKWDGFENCVADCVEKHNISNKLLCLEITEQDALSSSIQIIDKLKSLRTKGHKLMIDDFGMGHTSILYLQSNDFDVVKLDKTLTRDVLENKKNGDIIASLVYLGKSLEFTIVAEWVETEEQRDKLKKLGCNEFQGYLYSKPVEFEELVSWLQNVKMHEKTIEHVN